jgi:CubicO group peptidase (beta-lactamase class C family)
MPDRGSRRYGPGVDELERSVDDVAQRTGFSGAVRVDDAGGTRLAKAYGFADRANEIANNVDTRFAIASGVKGFTALTVMSLVEQGMLTMDKPARSVLGEDLPLIDDDVTIQHLLAHRSGIGDYCDEDDDDEITDYIMPVPVHQLSSTEQYLRVLDGFPQKFPPGERFEYCNGGYVVLALIAERVAGQPFSTLVQQAVCQPAGMTDTDYLRSDELPAGTALGYLFEKGPRTNIFHLPVVGTGDGGIYSTVADMHAFWTALLDGRILPVDRIRQMIEPRSQSPEDPRRYGLGFWLHATSDVVMLDGYDAGVSFRSVHDPVSGLTHTVVSNWSDGAWPVTRQLAEVLGT